MSIGNLARYTLIVSQIDPTFTITGRVGGPTVGLEIRAELDQDALKGRVGGIFGKDLIGGFFIDLQIAGIVQIDLAIH